MPAFIEYARTTVYPLDGKSARRIFRCDSKNHNGFDGKCYTGQYNTIICFFQQIKSSFLKNEWRGLLGKPSGGKSGGKREMHGAFRYAARAAVRGGRRLFSSRSGRRTHCFIVPNSVL